MSSLWKRASKNQMKLLRAVEGAVINEADAHKRPRNKIQARSIAKRAVGTISALWPDVLVAVRTPSSVKGVSVGLTRAEMPHVATCAACSRRAQWVKHDLKKRGVKPGNVAPLRLLIKELSVKLGDMKKTDPFKASVYIEVLRKTDMIIKGL